MSKKKSLGHNPLTQSSLGYASYDFIAPSENNKSEEDDGGEGASASVVNKTTASYYLEEPVVQKIRVIAEKHGTSYSALVNKILKNTLRNISVD